MRPPEKLHGRRRQEQTEGDHDEIAALYRERGDDYGQHENQHRQDDQDP
jgi:hypothetical protein